MDTAIVMYGAPAAGKDTVTAALGALDPRCRLYQRMKVGPGRTTGYRMASIGDLDRLTAAEAVIYSNRRYSSTYVIDRPELGAMLAAGHIPVLHVGQPEAIDALLNTMPATRWVVVELSCPRDIAAARIAARNTGDTAERLEAWEATPRLTVADLRINTAETDPEGAARQIQQAAQAAGCTIVVPTLHLVHDDGTLDLAATRRYAAAASSSWVDRFLLNGSTTSGDLLTVQERAAVLDAWLEVVDASRLLTCVWSGDDFRTAADRHVTPMAVMTATDLQGTQRFLEELPTGSTVYSHPTLLGHPFTPELAAWAASAGHLPAGGKLAKVQLQEIRQVHRVAPEFALWDGSSRRICESIQAGAAGIVATPLAVRLSILPPRSLSLIQTEVDAVQDVLDQLPTRPAKRQWLLDQVRTRC